MQKFLIFVSEQWLLVTALAAVIALLAWLENRRSGTSVNTHQLTSLVNRESAVIVDLRAKAEYTAGHIVDAVSVPFNQWQSEHSGGGKTALDKYHDKPIVLVCKMGQQSSAVAKRLQAAGKTDVYRLSGGLMEWQGNQMPLVK